MRKILIGVMGPGDGATKIDKENAYLLGKYIAEHGWTLLTGGRNQGVMAEANKGAKEMAGLTIGIIPTNNNDFTSPYVDIPIITAMGSARNAINVLSSNVVIACGMGKGTASEVALALKSKKPVILLSENQEGNTFFKQLDQKNVFIVSTPEEAIEHVKKLLT
jgi:uncharacterized protein (TIGR00725 family)